MPADRIERALFFFVLVVSLVPLWGVRFPPLMDFPQHVLSTQAIAAGTYDGGADYRGHLEIRSLWAPYGLFYILSAPLARIMPAIYAVKLCTSAIIVGTAFSLRWLLHLLARDPWSFYFGYPFFFTLAYLMGFLPYVLGIPVALVLAAIVVARPAATLRSFAARFALMVLLIWAHPVLYGAMAACAAAVTTLAALRRQITAANWAASLSWICCPAVFLYSGNTAIAVSGMSWRLKAAHFGWLWSTVGAYDPAVFVHQFFLPKLPLIAFLVWAAIHLVRTKPETGEGEDNRYTVFLAACAALLMVFTLVLPEWFRNPVRSGELQRSMLAPSFRLTPLALLLFAAFLPARITRPPAARVLLASWCLAVLFANVVLAVRFNHDMAGYVNIVQHMEPRQTAATIHEGSENQLFHHALLYYHVENGGISPRMFMVMPHVQPAFLTPPYPWTGKQWNAERADPLIDPGGDAFRYVVVKTSRHDTQALQPALPFHNLVARSGGWILFERR